MDIHERVSRLPQTVARSLVVALSKQKAFIYDPFFFDELCIWLALYKRTSLSEGLFLSAWKLCHISTCIYWDFLCGCCIAV